MIQAFFDWYLSGLAEFWSNVLTIRIPHILLVILLIWWMCGKGKRGRYGCSLRWGCCCARGGCKCTCGRCCCTWDGRESEPAAEHHAKHAEPEAEAEE